MADMKRVTPEKLLWLDLEMTGLDARRDLIVEVGAVVTDWDFNELDVFESGVGQDRAVLERLFGENAFAVGRPEETRELIELSVKSPSQAEVEARLVELVDKHFPAGGPALLAGNSIHMDRQFVRSYWPNLEEHLHYRMLDVSAWKVVMLGRYGVEFEKAEAHRALGDIRESIAELRYYLNYFGAEEKLV